MIIRRPWNLNRKDVPSDWKGLEEFIVSILEHFEVSPNLALEFGVDYGYSTSILSQLFNNVIGVDSFENTTYDGKPQNNNFYEEILFSFVNTNVQIVKSTFEDFIKNNNSFYDLIHVDGIHNYDVLNETIRWATKHSNVVLFHDTMEYREVKRIGLEIASELEYKFYSIPFHCGLGILHKIKN